MKMRRFFISFVFSLFCLNSFSAPAVPDSIVSQELGNLMNTVGVEMFEENYDILHTLSFSDMVDGMAAFCRRKGGMVA